MCTAQMKCVLPAEGSGPCVQGAGWGCCQQALRACGASTKPSSQGAAQGDIESGVMAVAVQSMCSSASAPFSSCQLARKQPSCNYHPSCALGALPTCDPGKDQSASWLPHSQLRAGMLPREKGSQDSARHRSKQES